ncbi:MAG: macB 10 [Mucilaginibacter sp.]|nr:macB 10 [Mucilaginibacter sp.]
MIKNYFKIAWRNLWRHKRMTAINVAGLGIGMAATVLIVLWVQNELSFDGFQPDSENIYRTKVSLAVSPHENWLWETSQYVLGVHALKEIPEIESLARIQANTYDDLNFHYNGNLITEKKSAYVDDQWFRMFHYDFLEGSSDPFLRNPFSLILTESAAKKYFGQQDAIGKILKLDSVGYQVQAIVKDNPSNSSFQFNVLIPLSAKLTNPKEKKNILGWGQYGFMTFMKLKPGADIKRVSAKLTQIVKVNRPGIKTTASFTLVKLKDIHFENDLMQSSVIHGNQKVVKVFIVLAVLLLITACINYVNLTTARASIRSKEVSIRKVVGAGRSHLFGQFMSESVLVSILALLFSILLVQITLPWFSVFTDKQFSNALTSPVMWKIAGITLIVAFLLNGLYPAILLSSFHPLNVFRGKALLNFKDKTLRKSLVVTQFTISVVLIIGTLVIFLQLRFMERVDLGYNKSQVFTFSLPWKLLGFDNKKNEAFLNTIKNEFRKQSAVADVSMANAPIVDFKGSSSGGFDWEGRPKDFNPGVAPLQVDQNFGKMMQLKTVRGRWFNSERSDQHNVLLNETAVQLLHIQQPVIGTRFIHQGDTGKIIGVLKDFHYQSLHDKIGPVIVAEEPGEEYSFYIKTFPRNNQAAISAANRIWEKFAPGESFIFNFLDEKYNSLYKAEQQSALLITLFAAIAIFVSALGLLGLAAFAAEQKVKEIGIRKVLGASIQHIVSLLSIDFIKMVVIASLIAFPIAWWAMNKWLQDFAYRISLSWWIFGGAAGIALIIALITVSFQSIKAAVANPVNSLRSE